MFDMIGGGLVFAAMAVAGHGPGPGDRPGLAVTSREVAPGRTIAAAQVYDRSGCSGGNVSPSLSWSGAPAAAKSFAITLYDPDAPNGGKGWWHWIVYNIPPQITNLPADAGYPGLNLLPTGARLGPTDFGEHAYGGPCPPKGNKPHRYIFTVYALDVASLDVPAGATPVAVGARIRAHAIAEGTLTAMYGR